MFDNILAEPSYVQDIYKDYLGLINRYKNYKRPSIFARYLNINRVDSIYDYTLEASFDYYNSGIKYDVYDFTPLYSTSQIINDVANNVDLKGQMFTGTLTITTFTIDRPHDNDLLVFNYAPSLGTEIFKVTGIRSALNAMKSEVQLNWFELTLEYAPLVDLSRINLLNHYVYTLIEEKYMRKDLFTKMLLDTEAMVTLFTDLRVNFNELMELYTYDNDGTEIAPLAENNILYEFLAKTNGNKYFANVKKPFGIKKYGTTGTIDTDGEVIDDLDVTLEEIAVTKFTNTINIYQMSYFIENWNW